MALHFTLSFFFLTLLFSAARACKASFVSTVSTTDLQAEKRYWTDFLIDQPSGSSNWANGSPYPVSWTKGKLDGIDTFSLELTRLQENGLYYVAQNVPASMSTVNVLLENVPAGDDYFIVCLNSTDGAIYAVSSRFTITDSSQAHANPNPDSSAPTATVTGPPNPLTPFATTLGPPVANAGGSLVFGSRSSPNTRVLTFGGILVLCSTLLGAVMTLW